MRNSNGGVVARDSLIGNHFRPYSLFPRLSFHSFSETAFSLIFRNYFIIKIMHMFKVQFYHIIEIYSSYEM